MTTRPQGHPLRLERGEEKVRSRSVEPPTTRNHRHQKAQRAQAVLTADLPRSAQARRRATRSAGKTGGSGTVEFRLRVLVAGCEHRRLEAEISAENAVHGAHPDTAPKAKLLERGCVVLDQPQHVGKPRGIRRTPST